MVLQEGAFLQGRYSIQRVLGEAGSFGIIYLVHDGLEEKDLIVREYFPVGLSRRSTDGMVVERDEEEVFTYGLSEYELEGNALLHLSHPHVVPVIDQFRENGTIYRLSDRLLGITLRAYMRQRGGKISESEAVELMLPLLNGMGAGHELDLVHGALSSTTIFMSEGKVPCLLDFQAARIYLAQLTGETKAVRVRGCSAPEIRTDRESIGPWTDVYSAAAMIYYMVVGRTLPTVIYPSHHDRLVHAVKKGDAISNKLKKVLLAALAMDAKERPQSMDSLYERLAAVGRPQHHLVSAMKTVFSSAESEESVLNLDDGIRVGEEAEDEIIVPNNHRIQTKDINGATVEMEERQGEQRIETTAIPSRRMEQLPAQKLEIDNDLQARLALLENRQNGMNRLIIMVLMLVFAAGTIYYFGPDFLNQLGSSATVAETDQGPLGPSTAAASPGNLSNADAGKNNTAELITPPSDTDELATTSENGTAVSVSPSAQPGEVNTDTQVVRDAAPAAVNNAVVPKPITTPQVPAQTAGPVTNPARSAALAEREGQYQYLKGQGDLLFDDKRWEKALDAYSSALVHKPADSYLIERIAIVTDSVERAADTAELVLENEKQYQYFKGQGDLFFQQQRWVEALNVFISALEFRPADAYLVERMAAARDSIDAEARAVEEESQLAELIKRVTDEDGIFVVPDTPPALQDEPALRAKVQYPSRASRAGVTGRVIVRMIVDEDGGIQSPSVVQGIGFGCDEEVVRVLESAQFEPATFRGKPVKAWYMFSMVFSLE